MFEFLDYILAQQLLAVIVTLIFWQLIYRFFNFINLSDTNWKRLEYIWIFIGLLGLLALINENKKRSIESELSNFKHEIILDMSLVNFLLSDIQTCTKYKKTVLSPENFDLNQSDQNLICEWSKNFNIEVDSITGVPTNIIDTQSIQEIKFKTDFMQGYVKEISLYISRINKNINKFNTSSLEGKKKIWDDFYKTIGVFLLIIAIAIRLALTKRNVMISKKC
ncbi:MAG: hypothetical protein M3Q58_05705 [Bacteroidota bacterium]|nr:hypothetical protein [Bacteroidota bacterium]